MGIQGHMLTFSTGGIDVLITARLQHQSICSALSFGCTVHSPTRLTKILQERRLNVPNILHWTILHSQVPLTHLYLALLCLIPGVNIGTPSLAEVVVYVVLRPYQYQRAAMQIESDETSTFVS